MNTRKRKQSYVAVGYEEGEGLATHHVDELTKTWARYVLGAGEEMTASVGMPISSGRVITDTRLGRRTLHQHNVVVELCKAISTLNVLGAGRWRWACHRRRHG